MALQKQPQKHMHNFVIQMNMMKIFSIYEGKTFFEFFLCCSKWKMEREKKICKILLQNQKLFEGEFEVFNETSHFMLKVFSRQKKNY